jgi:hypothetical protein
MKYNYEGDKNMERAKTMLSLITLALALIALPLQAGVTYSFTHILEPGDTASQLADGAIGEAQMFMDVSDLGGNQVLFTFSNTGPEQSIITDIYFDDDATLLNIAGLVDADEGIGGDTNVDFSTGASPPDLPAGNNLSPAFVTSAGLLADADPPPGTGGNGIDPGESLGIIMNLKQGVTYDDTLAALDSGLDLRVGTHVQGFATGNSETFVNNGRTPTIPAPSAIILASMGIGCVGYLRRRVL